MSSEAEVIGGKGRVCPRCHNTGWWSEGHETNGGGFSLIGGPCDHPDCHIPRTIALLANKEPDHG